MTVGCRTVCGRIASQHPMHSFIERAQGLASRRRIAS